MIRVVVDANVWISAAINPRSIPGLVINAALKNRFQSVLSTEIVDPVNRRLARLGSTPDDVSDHETSMWEASTKVRPNQTLTIVAGKDSDNRILKCAVAGNADYIVTGDKKHFLPLGTFQGIRIVSPRDFLAFIDVSEP